MAEHMPKTLKQHAAQARRLAKYRTLPGRVIHGFKRDYADLVTLAEGKTHKDDLATLEAQLGEARSKCAKFEERLADRDRDLRHVSAERDAHRVAYDSLRQSFMDTDETAAIFAHEKAQDMARAAFKDAGGESNEVMQTELARTQAALAATKDELRRVFGTGEDVDRVLAVSETTLYSEDSYPREFVGEVGEQIITDEPEAKPKAKAKSKAKPKAKAKAAESSANDDEYDPFEDGADQDDDEN